MLSWYSKVTQKHKTYRTFLCTVHAQFGAKAEKPKHQEIPDARIGHLGMYPSTCRALEVCIDVTMYLSKYKLSVNSVFFLLSQAEVELLLVPARKYWRIA